MATLPSIPSMPAIGGVLHALDVAARTRVAVPIPGSADTAARLEDTHGHPQPTQAMEHVEAGESGPDDHRIEIARIRVLARQFGPASASPCAVALRESIAGRPQPVDRAACGWLLALERMWCMDRAGGPAGRAAVGGSPPL